MSPDVDELMLARPGSVPSWETLSSVRGIFLTSASPEAASPRAQALTGEPCYYSTWHLTRDECSKGEALPDL